MSSGWDVGAVVGLESGGNGGSGIGMGVGQYNVYVHLQLHIVNVVTHIYYSGHVMFSQIHITFALPYTRKVLTSK